MRNCLKVFPKLNADDSGLISTFATTKLHSVYVNKYIYISIYISHTHLLLHLLNFPDRAASRLAVLMPEEVDVEISRLAELLFFLLLSILQLALCADALSVVHVVCFHHLQKEYDRWIFYMVNPHSLLQYLL